MDQVIIIKQINFSDYRYREKDLSLFHIKVINHTEFITFVFVFVEIMIFEKIFLSK